MVKKVPFRVGGSLQNFLGSENADGSVIPDVDGSPLPVELAVSMNGELYGKTAKNVFVLGRRISFAGTTPYQDLAQYLVGGQSAINIPNSSTTYYLNSTSANDAPGNTGARSVRIVYLDVNGVQQVTSKTLNGTTAVNIGSGYSFIQWMEVDDVGSNLSCVGDVTISSINGVATESTTIEMIKAGGNRSLSGRYKVPAGHTAYLNGWTVSAPGSQAMDVRLRATVFADDRSNSGVFHFQATAYLASQAEITDSLDYYKCLAGAIIKASTLPAATTGTPRCDVNFHMILVED